MVHRDVKPDNVLITDDHRVRIMDLGVAKVLDASLELTRGGDFAGTLAYAAPEQLQGETVTPTADLYALGVLLLELATGANPFRHEDVAAAISAHVNHVPRRITDTVEEVSPFLAEVVAALLEKRPEGRLGTAAELRQILSEGEETTWWRDREAPPVPVVPGRGLVPVRRETEIKGRALELAALRESWDAARRGDGRVLTVVGESGVGKSRLLDAFLESLPLDDARVLYGGFSPSGGEDALSGAVLRAFGREGLVAALASRMRDHAGLATAFAARLRPDGSVRAEKPLDGPAVVAAFGRLAQGLADEMPTIWIVEDLHFAGEEEHKAVFSVARAVADHRFLMIVTTRPDLVEDRIVSLTTMPSGRRIDLGRLSPRR